MHIYEPLVPRSSPTHCRSTTLIVTLTPTPRGSAVLVSYVRGATVHVKPVSAGRPQDGLCLQTTNLRASDVGAPALARLPLPRGGESVGVCVGSR